MEKKMTKREMFAMVLECVEGNAMLTDFINHEIELLNRKHTTRKPTKAQLENENLKSEILEVLEGAEPMTIGEIVKAFDNAYTSQKLSALVKQLKDNGLVERQEKGGKAVFVKI